MFTSGNKTIRAISANITEERKKEIEYYIKGAVDSYCNNNKTEGASEWFTLYTLFGKHFEEPLLDLFKIRYDKTNFEEAKQAAAIDAGWLLKLVLKQDEKKYEQSETQREFKVNSYRRIEDK
jgi:hypothetical protein